MSQSDLHVPRQVYRLRALGLGLGFLCVAAVFRERGASPVAWAALAAHAFLWPHVAWRRARSSANPNRAERVNLIVDSGLGGVWVALMEFSLLPSVMLIAMLSMDKVGWGVRFLARTSATMLATCAATAAATGASFRPATSMLEIVASLPLMVAYPVAVAVVSNRSGRLARERKKAVEQSAALREQLAHIARVGTLGEMAAGLAHELNQPLTAIHLEASSALELDLREDPDAVRECLTRISEQSLRAGDIVRRMRTFARHGRAHREAVDIGRLINEVLALLDHDLRQAGVELTLVHQADIPPVLVDRIGIQQVLVNLIRNGIEAMARSPATPRRLTVRTEYEQDHRVRVSVTDTGGGIDQSMLNRLFHPFQTTKPAGLGLGLSICQSLVEANGGRMAAGPHPAGGAMFFFEVPSAQETPL